MTQGIRIVKRTAPFRDHRGRRWRWVLIKQPHVSGARWRKVRAR